MRPRPELKMNVSTRLAGVVILGCLCAAQTRAQSVPAAADALFKKELAAIQSNSYDDFVAEGAPTFKALITKAAFDALAAGLRPRFDVGYTTEYLADMKKGGVIVHLWKLTFKDGKDDMLAAMIVDASGKVGGFLLQ
jgi:hypothetical protein